MGRSNCKLIKPSGSRQLHDRAIFFKRLAVGAADPKFAAKLQALVDEYEGEAARVEAPVETPATPSSPELTGRVIPRQSDWPSILRQSVADSADSGIRSCSHAQRRPKSWQPNTSPATFGTSY